MYQFQQWVRVNSPNEYRLRGFRNMFSGKNPLSPSLKPALAIVADNLNKIIIYNIDWMSWN
jgi:hypothetical protein